MFVCLFVCFLFIHTAGGRAKYKTWCRIIGFPHRNVTNRMCSSEPSSYIRTHSVFQFDLDPQLSMSDPVFSPTLCVLSFRAGKLPVIEAIQREFPDVAISIDTFRSDVANAACERGTDIVNDVSAGRLDESMRECVEQNMAGWVLMHMRGTPETMSTPEAQHYEDDDVVGTVASELSMSTSLARNAGIPRWNMIVDPGIGFAKNGKQNTLLLQKLSAWKRMTNNYPTLLGVSRKSILAHLVPRLKEQAPKGRDFATAGAAMFASILGADVIRVHNPKIADSFAILHEICPDMSPLRHSLESLFSNR